MKEIYWNLAIEYELKSEGKNPRKGDGKKSGTVEQRSDQFFEGRQLSLNTFIEK